MTEFYVDKTTGKVIKSMSDNHPNPPENSFKTPTEPESGRDIWNFNTETWIIVPAPKRRDMNKLIESLISKGIITKEDAEI